MSIPNPLDKPYVLGSSLAALVAGQLGLEVYTGRSIGTPTGEQLVYYATLPRHMERKQDLKFFYSGQYMRSGRYYNQEMNRAYTFWTHGLPEVEGTAPLATEFLSGHCTLVRPRARGILVCDEVADDLRTKFTLTQPPGTAYVLDGVKLLGKLLVNASIFRKWKVESIDLNKHLIYFSDQPEGHPYSAIASSMPLDQMVGLALNARRAWPRFHDGAQVVNLGAICEEPAIAGTGVVRLEMIDKVIDKVEIYNSLSVSHFVPTWDGLQIRRAYGVFHRVYEGDLKLADFEELAARALHRWGLLDAVEVAHLHYLPSFYPREEDGVEEARQQALYELQAGGIYQMGGLAKGNEPSIVSDVLDGLTVGSALGL